MDDSPPILLPDPTKTPFCLTNLNRLLKTILSAVIPSEARNLTLKLYRLRDSSPLFFQRFQIRDQLPKLLIGQLRP